MVSARPAQPTPSAPLLVERYLVCEEFASGGMATVHFALLLGAQGFRRTVAVKRLLSHLTRNRDFALMFVDEARLASRVCHPNVVPTLDVVQTENELLLVMEYVHGESLAALTRWTRERGERIPVPIACAIVADALHGLHAAHEAKDERGRELGLVHRDVSPQNILVGLDGIPRIADFGVAKAAGRAQSTGDGILKGKLAYMAPEQLSGGQVSRASDLFAAAVVLWEALTGERLFAGKNHAETAFKLLSAPIPSPRSRDASLPEALDALVMRGLARDPAQRFGSAREMALALEASVAGVRPSDLARWVEQVVGERLAARSALLRAIERRREEPEVDSQVATLPRAVSAEPTPRRAELEPRARDGAHDDAVEVAAMRRRAPRWALLSLALLALSLLVGVAALQRRDPYARVSAGRPPETTTHPVKPARAPAGAQGAPSMLTPRIETHAADSVAVESPTPQASAEKSLPVRSRAARAPRARDTHADCDPPFSIDGAGHVLFKPACMEQQRP